MKFNKFIWDLYAKSERGKKTIRKFTWLQDDFIESWCREEEYELDEQLQKRFPALKFTVNFPRLVQDAVSRRNFKNLEAANRYYEEVLIGKGILFRIADKKGRMRVVFVLGEFEEDWYDRIAGISLGLYHAHPDYFLPYNFRTKFCQLEEIHAEFNIPLPPVPGKHSKEDRGTYYLSINQAWHEFRNLHGLSPEEMCAFLYDFAPQFTTPMDAGDLPSPSKVWLTTGGTWDFEFLDRANENDVNQWGGNSAIRRGDIIMMYCVRPYACIHSIWRACSDGFIDPFFHYHGTVWICGRIKTVPVTFAELKQHPLLSQKSAVRAHFQGPSSKAPVTVEEYEAVLEMMKAKGQDLSVLPRIPWRNQLPAAELRDERDVEVQLIEPFLKKLGYKEKDWIRQMPVRMGRGERNYPDYALGARNKRGEESARMVLESKYQLSSQREFVDAFYQTKSYALRLQAMAMAMAAKEGIWIFPPENGTFDLKKTFHKTWAELTHPDAFHEVLIQIGRDKIL